MSGVNFAAAPAGLLGGLGMLRRCATMCAERARCCSSGGGGLLAPQGVGSARRRGCGRRKRGLAPNPGGSQPACLPLTDPPISRTPRVPALLCHLSESTGIVKHPLRGLGRAWEGATEVWARHQRLSAATAACAGVTGTRGSPAVEHAVERQRLGTASAMATLQFHHLHPISQCTAPSASACGAWKDRRDSTAHATLAHGCDPVDALASRAWPCRCIEPMGGVPAGVDPLDAGPGNRCWRDGVA